MSKLVNPKVEVKILGVDTLTVSDLTIGFDISKDLDEEPNDAMVSIFNLSEDQRGMLTNSELVETPVEISLTGSGSTELVKAFAGEIDDVYHLNLRPGHETRISCTSQKSAHYSSYVDALTFAMGTPASTVINALADAIDISTQFCTLSPAPILLSQSFTGLAFKQLEKFCRDYGYRVFVLDGVLKISSVYMPQNIVPKVILPMELLSHPIPRKVIDGELIERMSVAETVGFDALVALPTNKKKTKLSKKPGPSDWVEYNAVDKQLEGWDFEFLCQPDIQPDDVITVATTATAGKLLRVRDVNHFGDNETFDDWTSVVQTTVYEAL